MSSTENKYRRYDLASGSREITIADGDMVSINLGAECAEGERVVSVGRGAKVVLAEVCGEGSAKSALILRLAEGSQVDMTAVYLGEGGDVHHRVELAGADAEFEYRALYIVGGEERMNLALDVRHEVADCRSSEIVKGIAAGTAKGRFSGMIYVAPDAQRTAAFQQSRNLLLNDRAEIKTEPQLEIYADDVKCSHGATVGMMDEDAIWYMRQRGLDEAAARRLQMMGFAADVTSHIADEELRSELEVLIDRKLDSLN
ncbi:MAG: SufD family Fe-S cluster assembly protein [Tidjanibacter sp.]|nr:SufD family Fe-S cluster assembly protein [Tidjanibacter sp.]